MSNTVKVKLPNGTLTTADLGSTQGNGYRTASVRVTNSWGDRVRVAGRVTTRHGYNHGHILPFEVNMRSIHAVDAFDNNEAAVYAS